MGWIALARNKDKWRALVNTLLNLGVPENFWKFQSGCTTDGLSNGAQVHTVV
jgi:hypothetical protein